MEKKSSFGKIVQVFLVLALVLIGGVIYYAASGRTEFRSKAAEEEIVMKAWDFQSDTEGWYSKSLASFSATGGKLVAVVGNRKDDAIMVDNVNTTLSAGKKKFRFDLSVTSPKGGQYSFNVGYLRKGATEWDTLKMSGNVDGKADVKTLVLPQTLGAIGIDKIRVGFASVPEGATISIDNIRLISVKPAGLVEKRGTVVAKGDGFALQEANKAVSVLKAATGSTIDFGKFKDKVVNLRGTLTHDGNTAIIVVAAESDITLGQEDIVLKDYDFDTDTEGWYANNLVSSGVSGGSYVAGIGAAKGAAIFNEGVGEWLAKGQKRISFNLAVKHPNGGDYRYSLILVGKDPKNPVKLSLSGKADDQMKTVDVKLPDGGIAVKKMTIAFSGAPSGSQVRIDGIKFIATKPVGSIYRRGRLFKEGDAYKLKWTGKDNATETFIIRAASGVTIPWDQLVNTAVFVDGTYSFATDGKTRIITIADADDIGPATEDVVVKAWEFTTADDWYADNLTSSGVTDGVYTAMTGSAANPRIFNDSDAVGMRAGKKSLVVTLAVKTPSVSDYAFPFMFHRKNLNKWESVVLKGKADDQIATVEVDLPSGSILMDKLAFVFKGAPAGTQVRIDSIRFMATVPAGVIERSGKLTKEAGSGKYLLTVSSTERYYLTPAAQNLPFDSSLNQMVHVTGEFDTAAKGAVRTIKVTELLFVGLPVSAKTCVKLTTEATCEKAAGCNWFADTKSCQ